MFNEKAMRKTPVGRSEQIIVRKPTWTFNEIQGQKPKSTFGRMMFGAMSLVFPEGERFFIRSVKAFADQITDPRLKEDVKNFIGQEAQHGKMHDVFNRNILGPDFDIEPFLAWYKKYFFDILETSVNERFGTKLALSVTAAAEHFTATWALNGLDSEYIKANVTNQELRDFMMWHAVEEIEHKHVAFDVLQAVDDSYPLRIAGMALTAIMLPTVIGSAFIALAMQKKDLDPLAMLKSFFSEASEGNIFKTYGPAFLAYLKPGFHPSDDEGYELAKRVVSDIESRMQKVA